MRDREKMGKARTGRSSSMRRHGCPVRAHTTWQATALVSSAEFHAREKRSVEVFRRPNSKLIRPGVDRGGSGARNEQHGIYSRRSCSDARKPPPPFAPSEQCVRNRSRTECCTYWKSRYLGLPTETPHAAACSHGQASPRLLVGLSGLRSVSRQLPKLSAYSDKSVG